MNQSYDYGLWSLVIVNSAIFIFFIFSFTKPKTKTDWRSFGAVSGFIVALFTEMYGFPLTIYLLSGWLTKKFPEVDLFSHGSGHLWQVLFGWKASSHFDPIHIASNIFIFGGLFYLSKAWAVLHRAQKSHSLAKTGAYSYSRHPQYVAFILIMFGFLVQWPTLPTLIMFPILVWIYVRLAKREERQAIAEFGDEYLEYKKRVPGFMPNLKKLFGKENSEGRAN